MSSEAARYLVGRAACAAVSVISVAAFSTDLRMDNWRSYLFSIVKT